MHCIGGPLCLNDKIISKKEGEIVVNYQKLLAMFWAGLGGMTCLLTRDPLLYPLGAALLSGVMCFAVGEANGKRIERSKKE